MLIGKDMVMKDLRDYRLNPNILLLITDKEEAMAPFLRYVTCSNFVGPCPLHSARVQKSPAPGCRGD
jgi:hypothetical protein